MRTSSTSSVVQGTCLQNRLDALRGTPWSMGYSRLPSTNCHRTRRLSVTPGREVSQVQLEPVLYYSTSLTIGLKFRLRLSGQTVAVLNARNPLLPIFLAVFELPVQNSITSLDSHLLALLNASKSLLVVPLSYYQSSWPFSSRSYRPGLASSSHYRRCRIYHSLVFPVHITTGNFPQRKWLRCPCPPKRLPYVMYTPLVIIF
jgi:hypothetical protein